MRSQNIIYSAEQEAIMKAIETTRKLEENGDTKNPKTRILRKMLVEEAEKVSLVWELQEMKWQT
jgi:hypothetical protein